MFVPKIETTSPGEVEAFAKLAAFSTAVMVGVGERAGETARVTEIASGLLEAPVELSVMLPEYVPAASPEGLVEMARAAGVVPLAGLTESQLPPEKLVAEALKVRATPLLPIDTLCAAGTALSVW